MDPDVQDTLVDEWIEAYGYGEDDFVFGNKGLLDNQVPALQELLDIVRPGWRELFE